MIVLKSKVKTLADNALKDIRDKKLKDVLVRLLIQEYYCNKDIYLEHLEKFDDLH
jgi:hypothetical protein